MATNQNNGVWANSQNNPYPQSEFLDKQTNSQSETVYNTIQLAAIDGFIFIKDSDGYYECNLIDENNQIGSEWRSTGG